MTTKLLFFNIFITQNGEKTNYPLDIIIDKIYTANDSEQRLKGLSSGYYTFNNMRPTSMEKDTQNRTIWISKYREKKPFEGKKGTDEAKPITGDIMEPATFLFIPASNLLITEYNHIGCKDKGIREYINSFLINSDGLNSAADTWEVEIIPIKTKKGFDLIENSKNIKSVEIEFITQDSVISEMIKENVKEKNQTIIKKLLGSVEIAKELKVSVTKIVLKQSRFKQKIDLDLITAFLGGIDMEHNGISSVKVKFLNSETNKTETIDLKHDGLMQATILEGDNSNGFDFLAREISLYYYGMGARMGYNEHLKYSLKAVKPDLKIVLMDQKVKASI